jgi:putative ABC transport system permease protein
MKNIIDELKTSSVLTKQEIERIKLYVKKKYPNNSSKENALILSSTIYQIIDNNLEGINVENKQNIKKNILQSTILNDKKSILKWDVFHACTTELKENPQMKTFIISWINKNQKNTVSQESFEEYVAATENTSDGLDLSYLDIKLPPSYEVAEHKVYEHKVSKYHRLLSFKLNFKNQILKYKNEASLHFHSLSERIGTRLELLSNMILSRKMTLSLLILLIVSLYSLNNLIIDSSMLKYKLENKNTAAQNHVPSIDTADLYIEDAMSYHPHLPDYFNYKNIDKDKLLEFLNTKNSILAQEPYFSAIIRSSKEFNLNPHILFAITGQEQSFVPKNNEDAKKIANNPFNVFHSWQEYNTDIYDSSRIAARTVINLAKDKPADVDIFDWINSKYANDKNWGNGVKEIFEELGQ